jgi:hypothetical protein
MEHTKDSCTYTFKMQEYDDCEIVVSGQHLHIHKIVENFAQFLLACTFSQCQIADAFKTYIDGEDK